MKGMAIPVNIIVVVALAVVLLAVIGMFLVSSSFGGISTTQAQRIFASGCTRYCSSELYQTFQNAYDAMKNDRDFVEACTVLGYIKQSETLLLNKCLSNCGNCNVQITQNDLAAGLDNGIALTDRG